jgi:hypothetical protein
MESSNEIGLEGHLLCCVETHILGADLHIVYVWLERPGKELIEFHLGAHED